MTARPVHPLDVDLADLVDGLLDPDRTTAVETHLEGCLLCRIKCQRLRDAPPVALHVDRLFPAPPFPVPAGDSSATPVPDDLWLAGTGEGEGLLVLVLRTSGDRALVAPVTYDTDAADEETLIVGDLAVYPQLATELPRALLVHRLRGGVATTGAPVGAPISGPTDPRLDVRQYLADRLGSLEVHPPSPRARLMADLRELRGDHCVVRALDGWEDAVLAQRAGWAPLMTIDEVGIVLVVFDTPHGLADDLEFNAARAVLTRFNATAVVVLSADLSDLADVFDSASLNYGVDAPSGRRTPPRPLISGLSPFDAIAKFLYQTSGARAGAATTRGPVERVDVVALLRDAASAALADAVRQASRFKIAPKRRGYESVADAEDAFQAVLQSAFDREQIGQALVDLASPPEGEL